MKQRVEVVRWVDAELNSDDPQKPEWFAEPCLVLTVGILAKETEESLYLALDAFTDGTYRDYLVIPKACVLKRHRLGTIDDMARA